MSRGTPHADTGVGASDRKPALDAVRLGWLAVFPLLLLLAAGDPPRAASHQGAGQLAPVPGLQVTEGQQEGPALAAKFSVSTATGGLPTVRQGDWYLLRGADRIERVRPDAGTAEIWERDDRGDVSLKRVFRNEARVIEYAPGNLRAMQLQVRWEALGAAVDPRLVRALERGPTVETPYGPATVFEGVMAEVPIQVWWLDELQLPVRVIEQRPNGKVIVELEALHSRPPGDWPRAELPAQAAVEIIDVADLGDRHYDPFGAKVEEADAALRGPGVAGR